MPVAADDRMLISSMVIDRRLHRAVGAGFYADIFAVGEAAYKLFRSGPEIPPRQTRDGRRRVFESQCEAFKIAQGDPWLCGHIAAFRGVRVVEDVLGDNGESLQDAYLLDCCYGIELFGPGEIDFKVTADCVRNQGHIGRALDRFATLGIAALDASVFFHGDPDRFKFIDIEIRNWY
jgi:hypothetical protein